MKKNIIKFAHIRKNNETWHAEPVQAVRIYDIWGTSATAAQLPHLFIYKYNNHYILTDAKTGALAYKARTIKEIESALTDPELLAKIEKATAGEAYRRNCSRFAGLIYDNILSGFDVVKEFYYNSIMTDILKGLNLCTI